MKLQSIQIKNYRSIENITFDLKALSDGSYTYGLIGINEAGKSSILKAIALKDATGQLLPIQKDFIDKKTIEIIYSYILDKGEIDECIAHLSSVAPTLKMSPNIFSHIDLITSFEYSDPGTANSNIQIQGLSDEDAVLAEEQLWEIILNKSQKCIFWTVEDKYLISKPIDLSQFSVNQDTISIPLKNCFLLAKISNATERITSALNDSTERSFLAKELGKKVTEHINRVWPAHDISIEFEINAGLIEFHIVDNKTDGKPKTTNQRSDGFRQFVSFLLNISAQDENNQLTNTILLLDEPETHLHPQAQEDLLKELVKITKNDKNNIVFFATHSNYMIDKNDLSRNFRIEKPKPKNSTTKEVFDKKDSSYAEVSYEVFGISSTDYHNQLYDDLRRKYAESISEELDDVGIIEFDNAFFNQIKKLNFDFPFKTKKNKATLPTYIRNCIHYPKNKTKEFEKKLKESIALLKEYEK